MNIYQNVKTLATLRDKNIVSYEAYWIEPVMFTAEIAASQNESDTPKKLCITI